MNVVERKASNEDVSQGRHARSQTRKAPREIVITVLREACVLRFRATSLLDAVLHLRSWRRPTLPRPRSRSTIGADRLNDRVRDGNGCGPVALVASKNPDNRRVCSDAETDLWTGKRYRLTGN